MVLVQIPELTYDLAPKRPVRITAVSQLDPERLGGKVFASVEGTPDFEDAFIYQRYGLSYTYFTIQPYGLRMVVRTFEKVDDSWRNRRQFLGKLRPFDDQPFSYAIEEIYRSDFDVEVPENSYFLALDDVPKVSGWQLGAAIFALVMFAVLFYLFFFFGPLKSPFDEPAPGRPEGGSDEGTG
jgi:hypothetical protein